MAAILKSALCVLEVDDKSSFLMSGHAGPWEGLLNCESDLRVARESWDLPQQVQHSIRLAYVCSIHFRRYFSMTTR